MNEYNNSSEESLHNTISEPQSDDDVFENDQSDDTPSSEVDFEIEFEDDLGPSLKEMLEEASREVQVEQKQEEHPNSDSVVEEVSDSEQHNVDTEGKRWYVVHCYSGYENKVCHNLEQRIESMGMNEHIFDVVVPTEEEIAVRDGKRRTVEREVFPGYILVQMELSEESWYVVRNTPGVTGFVGMGT
ncbi:MAG: transcription termination/antitermination NusG family protein, partial [Anaerolineales bacterium]|nr:transcription termination/antitermination NusG family protein [Anaerolineales bacterium]